MIRKTKGTRPAPVGWRNRLRWLPQTLLLNAAERAHRLRYLGKATFNNRPHEVVSYANEDAMQTSLILTANASASKLEWLGNDALQAMSSRKLFFRLIKQSGISKFRQDA